MPKRKPPERQVTVFERELVELLDAVAPGGVEFARTKAIFTGDRSGFRVTTVTRSLVCDYLDESLSDAVAQVLHDVKSGEDDPIIPRFHRLGRFEREAVRRVLEVHAAEHMARAARAKLGAGGNAAAEYALADAFNAALHELHCDEHDIAENGDYLPGTPKLEAEQPAEPIHVARPRSPKKAATKS